MVDGGPWNRAVDVGGRCSHGWDLVVDVANEAVIGSRRRRNEILRSTAISNAQ